MGDELTDEERIGRLGGIQQHLKLLENTNSTFLQLPNLFDADPAVKEPFVLSNSFIPERIGGSVRIVHKNTDTGEHEPLETENLNQMLGSFLPGGFKKRWQRFDLWQGHWDYMQEKPGTADIGPMFEFEDEFPLGELLGDDVGEYTVLDVDIDDVTVYIPSTQYVKRLDRDANFYWSVDYQTIVAAKEPVGRTLFLGRSDPTTNYLWFRHLRTNIDDEPTSLGEENDVITSYVFDDEVEFLRCYYTSLLTLYEKDSNETLSQTLDYVHRGDDCRAFVASSERSQLLQFHIDRQEVREQVDQILTQKQKIRRDLQISKLHREVWDQLFFQEKLLDHVFEVEPFVDHLIAIDYMCQKEDLIDADTIFDADIENIISELERLLEPGEGLKQGPLCMMGYDPAPSSDILKCINEERELISNILNDCADENALLDFAEEVLVHSVEHALSTWTAEEALASGSFELWYDVNFQGRDESIATVGIFDSIQGGAGIADEVHKYLSENPSAEIDAGTARQSACHTAAADRTVLELLSGSDGETLYELFRETSRTQGIGNHSGEKTTGFQSQLEDARDRVISGMTGAYNRDDLTSHIENRIQSLFETREIARFNAYVAIEHETVESLVQRTPHSVDMILHLHQHIFTDPRVRDTYYRFANDAKGRDLSELGERLEELTLQCITACPDCLETAVNNCVHGTKYQAQMLSRRLLREVLD